MTLKYEMEDTVIRTGDFLLSLTRKEVTPRIPADIRDTARRLLRHYPTRFDAKEIFREAKR